MREAAAQAALEQELDGLFEGVMAAVASTDRTLAHRRAVHAVSRGLDEPLVLVLAAEAASDSDDMERARRYLEQATQIEPNQPEVWRRLGDTLAALARLAEAEDALERSLTLRPDDGPTLLSAASVLFRRGDLAAADRRFEAAAAALPDAAAPLEGIAAVAARRRQAPRARQFAERALALPDATPGAHLTLCRADILDGEPATAEARASRLIDWASLKDDARVAALDVRAEARDADGDVDGAFADYTRRNALLDSISRDATWRASEPPADRAARIAEFLSSRSAARWRRDGSGRDWEGDLKARAHVFLVGFPRSGTTLLEKMLASHRAAAALEEVDHLGAACADLLADNSGLERLIDLSPEDANRRRAIYWQGVRETLGAGFAGRVVVDKLPLHTLALPAIARLFPSARILFAIRDPRDVVLSCFRRRFALNAAMAEFLRLERAAIFYDAVMRLAVGARTALALNVREVRMERMVAEFDAEAAGVLGFLGLPWDDRVRNFAGAAQTRIRTPSDLQLTRGLDDAGIGQWRRYAAHLAPILPWLQPWVEAHGYA